MYHPGSPPRHRYPRKGVVVVWMAGGRQRQRRRRSSDLMMQTRRSGMRWLRSLLPRPREMATAAGVVVVVVVVASPAEAMMAVATEEVVDGTQMGMMGTMVMIGGLASIGRREGGAEVAGMAAEVAGAGAAAEAAMHTVRAMEVSVAGAAMAAVGGTLMLRTGGRESTPKVSGSSSGGLMRRWLPSPATAAATLEAAVGVVAADKGEAEGAVGVAAIGAVMAMVGGAAGQLATVATLAALMRKRRCHNRRGSADMDHHMAPG